MDTALHRTHMTQARQRSARRVGGTLTAAPCELHFFTQGRNLAVQLALRDRQRMKKCMPSEDLRNSCRNLRGRHLAEQVALRDGDVRADALLTQHLLLCAAPRIPRTLILRSTDSCRGPAGARTGCPTSLAWLVSASCMSLWRRCTRYFSRRPACVSPHRLMSRLPSRTLYPLSTPGLATCATLPQIGVLQTGSMGACTIIAHASLLCLSWSTARQQNSSTFGTAGGNLAVPRAPWLESPASRCMSKCSLDPIR